MLIQQGVSQVHKYCGLVAAAIARGYDQVFLQVAAENTTAKSLEKARRLKRPAPEPSLYRRPARHACKKARTSGSGRRGSFQYLLQSLRRPTSFMLTSSRRSVAWSPKV